MSSHRVPDAERARAPRPLPARVVDFFDEAGTLTPSADAPLLPEWTDWAGRYETLDDVWSACRTPELLVFILGHAVRLQYVGNPDAVRDGLERFVAWCADLAGLDPQEVAEIGRAHV